MHFNEDDMIVTTYHFPDLFQCQTWGKVSYPADTQSLRVHHVQGVIKHLDYLE